MARVWLTICLLGLVLLWSDHAAVAQTVPPISTPATATSAPEPTPAPCAAAAAAAGAGQAALAVEQYLAAAQVPATQACAIDGLLALAPTLPGPNQPCRGPRALREAGSLTEARSAYVAVLKEKPDLECAAEGLSEVALAEVTAACAKGTELRNQGALDSAAKVYETALDVGVNAAVDTTCATEGLDAVRADKATAAPAQWGRWFEKLVKVLVTGLWIVVLGLLALWVLGWAAGWAVRGMQRFGPARDRVTLVPRLRLEPVGLVNDGGSAAGITSLLRGQLRTVQIDGPAAEVTVGSGDSVSTTVAAIKEFDPKLAAVATLAAEIRRLSPWPSLSISTHQLPAGANGIGLSISIVHGSREPAATVLWRFEGDGKQVQDVYDLLPAAAIWILIESGRASRVASDLRSPQQIDAIAYAESARRLNSAGNFASARKLFAQALELDPQNPTARLGVEVRSSSRPLDERPEAVRAVLEYLYTSPEPLAPVARQGAPWGVGA